MRTDLINRYFQMVLTAETPEQVQSRLGWARLALTEAEYTALLGKLASLPNHQAGAKEQNE